MPFLAATIFGYTAGIALAAVVFVHRSENARRLASIVFAVTWLLHLGAVVSAALSGGGVPLRNVSGYLLVLGFVVLTLHLYLWFRHRFDVAGIVLPPISALAAFGALQLPADNRGSVELSGGWFLFHTVVSTIGMATLCVAFAMALVYLLQDRALKARQTLRLLERFPALEKCDRIGLQALVLGFLLLTIGIGTGLMMNAAAHGTLWVPGIKQIAPVLAWGVFGCVLFARLALGVRGRRSAYLTITGFALGLLTLLGMTV
ncbi:MAG: cytochrome c biogenesis protein CcsA [bacterium]|nr:cytochrome c biogenesis protein CcsA [bacterium]